MPRKPQLPRRPDLDYDFHTPRARLGAVLDANGNVVFGVGLDPVTAQKMIEANLDEGETDEDGDLGTIGSTDDADEVDDSAEGSD